MNFVQTIHQKLHRWQQSMWARVVLTLIFSASIITLLALTLIPSYHLSNLRTEVLDLLTGPEQRIAALQLEETGFLELNGVKYGDDGLKGTRFLDANGIVINPFRLTALVLLNEIPRNIPIWLLQSPNITWVVGAIALVFCAVTVWMGLFLPLLYSSVIAFIGWIFFQWVNSPNAARAIVGMSMLGFSYHLIITMLKLVFRSPRSISSLARGVLIEATRTRLAITFLTILLLILPVIPLMLDPESPLRHRVQTLLSRGLGTTFTIAAFLTVFLGCATVAFEIRDRQIWQVLTKPVSRLNYLLGKWVGIMSLNLVILTIAGASVFMYVQYLRTAQVAPGEQGRLDRGAVETEILTARLGAHPTYDLLTNEQLSARVELLIEADPELRDEEQIHVQLRQKLRQDVQDEFLILQRAIPPSRDGGVYSQTYRFEGLQHAKTQGSPLTFKYRFHIGQSDEHETYRAMLVFNGDMATQQEVTYIPTMTHVAKVNASYIDDDGVLNISIYNLYVPPPTYTGKGTLSFDKGGIELLYRVSDFEGNFFRAMLVLWIKLAFLAALALTASTFLSFPVACMITLTIFASGTLAPYLSESLQAYTPLRTSDIDMGNIAHLVQWAFEHTIRAIATGMVFVLDGFGAQRPTDQLVDGKLVSWASVLKGALTIGVMWSGITIAIGATVLKKRQLAIYSGSG